MKNLQVKFVFLIISIMTISAISSFTLLTVIFRNNILAESKNSQNILISNIIDLYSNTDFSLKRIIEISNNSKYEVSLLSPIEEVNHNVHKLRNKEMLQLEKDFIPFVDTIFRLDNNFIKVSSSFNNKTLHFRMILLNSIYLLISIIVSLIISTLFSKRILSPIRNLSNATEKISKGNFNVRVIPPKDYELGLLTENFNKMAKELSSIETLRNDFVNNVSHEIKTPLGSIQGFAKLIQNNISDKDKIEFTNIIIEESQRLSKLTSNILKLSKLENQDILTELNLFSLDEQIRNVIVILEKEWSKKSITFHIDLDTAEITSNKDLLEHVWLNILGNAIKFTNTNGSITVKLSKFQDKVIIKISDNGIGMDEQTQKHIFEKFYQGDKSHKSSGNGLGLPLVKRIIELCNGKIRVRSSPSYGSSFTIELPKIPYTL